MPVSRTVEEEGFRVSVRPGFWLRRWTRFPLYFQATRPTFEIKAAKVREEQQDPGTLGFKLVFEDRSNEPYSLDVSSMGIGDERTLKTDNVLLWRTGDVSMRLDPVLRGDFEPLFAFYVSPEATLVFLLLNAVLAVAFTAVVTLVLR